MKTGSKNDVLEIISLDRDETQPRLMHNDLQVQDARAKIAFALIQSWGAMATFGDIISQFQEKPTVPVKPIPPQELVMRVCEVVDAAWNEMQHRGWIINVDSLGD